MLKDHPLADYSAEQVLATPRPNVRDCKRIGQLARTEQDVLRIPRTVK
jgi:hypothetical protein